MALEIINRKIVGTIDNLQEKLSGEIPVTRLELIHLVNSWERTFAFVLKDSNDNIIDIEKEKSKECYDLSKLNVSEITDMSSIFRSSNFNGDVSNWNTSNVTDMQSMFFNTKEFNSLLNDWVVSKVTNMSEMFSYAKSFNQALNLDTSKVTNMDYMFDKALAFENKYNSGRSLPNYTNEIKDWLNDNRDRMNAIDIKDKHGKEIDDFFNNIYSTNRNELKLNDN